MSNIWNGEKAPVLQRSIKRKIDLRLVTFGIILQFLSILDRSNIGNAFILNAEKGRSLSTVLGLSSIESNVAVMLFAVGELSVVPIILRSLRTVGPNVWFGCIVMSWGIVSMCTSLARSFAALCVLRTLLGIFEGCLFPGIIFCMSLWYPQAERSTRIAFVWATSSLGGAFGGILAYAVSHMDGTAGKYAWEWLYLIEGMLTICIGITALIFFPSSPASAGFLTAEEREALQDLGPSSSKLQEKPPSIFDTKVLLQALSQPYIWYQCFAFGCISGTFISLASFSPSVIRGLNQSSATTQLLSVPPYVFGYILMLISAPLADSLNARSLFVAGFAVTGSIMFMVLAVLPAGHYIAAYVIFIIAVGCFVGASPLQLSWITTNHAGTDAISVSIGSAFVVGQSFQIGGAWIYRPNDAPAYHTGHWINFGLMLGTAFLTLLARYELIRMKQKGQSPENPFAL